MTQTVHADIETLMGLLDRWRHFASYPLEPRADALFALFLPVVFEKRLKVEIHPEVIPQFPLKKVGKKNLTEKVDYFALSKCGKQAFLIEVKTDMDSWRENQYKYLKSAKERGMARILCELKQIAKCPGKPKYRRKYFHILHLLSQIGLVELTDGLECKMYSENPRGVSSLIDEIKIIQSPELEIVYVQPRCIQTCDNETHCISFADFADTIKGHGNFGALFARYLRTWAQYDAGQIPPSRVGAVEAE